MCSRRELQSLSSDTQFGFRPNKGTRDAIFILCQIAEKVIREEGSIHLCLIDLEKAFDGINRKDIWETFQKKGLRQSTNRGIQSLKVTRTRLNTDERDMKYQKSFKLYRESDKVVY